MSEKQAHFNEEAEDCCGAGSLQRRDSLSTFQTINEKRADLVPLTSSEANQCRFIRDKVATYLESRYRSHHVAFQVLVGAGNKVMPVETFRTLLVAVFGEESLRRHGQEGFIISLVDPFQLGFISSNTFVGFVDLDTVKVWEPSRDVDVSLAVLMESVDKKSSIERMLMGLEKRLYIEAESVKDLFLRLGPVNGHVSRESVISGLVRRNISEAEAQLMWAHMAKDGQSSVDFATFASVFSDPDPSEVSGDRPSTWSGPAFVPSIGSNGAVEVAERHESSNVFATVTDPELLESRKWSSDARCEQVIQANVFERLQAHPEVKPLLANEILRAAFKSEDDTISIQDFERMLIKELNSEKMMPPVVLYLEKKLSELVPAVPNRVSADAALAFLEIQQKDIEQFQAASATKISTPKTPRQMSRLAASSSQIDKDGPHARANRKVLQTIARQIEDKSDQLPRVLRSFDKAGSGVVSVEDYFAALAHAGIFVSEADYARVVALVDEEGAGNIRYSSVVADLRAGIAAEKPAVFMNIDSAELNMTRQFEELSGCYGKTSMLTRR